MSPRQPHDHEAYRPRPDTSQIVAANEALFTFPDANDAVDKYSPEPAKTTEVATDEFEWPQVRLADAAVALDGIMKAYNRRSRAKGIKELRHTPDNRFDTRYGTRADEVDANTAYKAERQENEMADHLAVLGDSERMTKVFGKDQAIWYTNRVEDHLERNYGPGNSHSRSREKLVKRVKKIIGEG